MNPSRRDILHAVWVAPILASFNAAIASDRVIPFKIIKPVIQPTPEPEPPGAIWEFEGWKVRLAFNYEAQHYDLAVSRGHCLLATHLKVQPGQNLLHYLYPVFTALDTLSRKKLCYIGAGMQVGYKAFPWTEEYLHFVYHANHSVNRFTEFLAGPAAQLSPELFASLEKQWGDDPWGSLIVWRARVARRERD